MASNTVIAEKLTSADLERMPDDGNRYELIAGELFVSTQPTFEHQYSCSQLDCALTNWNNRTGLGVTVISPGLVLAEDDDVAPDLVWISRQRVLTALDEKRHFRVAPELVVEVLSPGRANERRDREVKLQLYSRSGVLEYWVVNWMLRLVEVYRREPDELKLVATLSVQDTLESPLLPGFSAQIAELFFSPDR